jgi:hypothetical protein
MEVCKGRAIGGNSCLLSIWVLRTEAAALLDAHLGAALATGHKLPKNRTLDGDQIGSLGRVERPGWPFAWLRCQISGS